MSTHLVSSPITEAEWLRSVGDALDLTGWAWIHHRPARRAQGKWTTPTQGSSAKGFPDIVAVRPPRVLWLELKTERGRVSPEQTDWLERLRASGQEVHVIRLPRDWHLFTDLTAPEPEQLTLTSNSTAASFVAADDRR
jgi:acetyl esterase/lipase